MLDGMQHKLASLNPRGTSSFPNAEYKNNSTHINVGKDIKVYVQNYENGKYEK